MIISLVKTKETVFVDHLLAHPYRHV